MSVDTLFLIGVIFASSTYLILDRNFWNILIGFVVFSNGVNLLLLSTSQTTDANKPPIIDDLEGVYTDPLPHALILTAIVISFGLIAYFASLIYTILHTNEEDLNA